MNRTATLIASLTLVGLSACTPQQRQLLDNVVKIEPTTNEVVVTCDPATTACTPPAGPPPEYNPTPTTIYDPAIGNDDPAICCDLTTTTS